MARPSGENDGQRRKLIAFHPDAWLALPRLARDGMKSPQEPADEAFGDLPRNHRRPVALRESARLVPANDPVARLARNRRHPSRKKSK